MNKLNLYLTIIFLFSMVVTHQTAIIQNPKLSNTNDGFLELKPNGSLILRSTLNNSSSVWQEALIFQTILNAIRLSPQQTRNTFNDLNQKMYGDGVEHKFPPFLERVIQRIQTYFSIYKYTDTSHPVRVDNQTTTASDLLNETLTLDENEIDINLSSGSTVYQKNNKTSVNVDKFTRPLQTTTTTSTKPIKVDDVEEENEFIEIKKQKKRN